MPRTARPLLDAAQFQDLLDRLPVASPHRGHHDPAVVRAARDLIVEGITVACGEGPAEPAAAADADLPRAQPSPYRLTQWYDGFGEWQALNDHLEMDVHGGMAFTHIDTINHFFWRGRNHLGEAPVDVTHGRPTSDALAVLREGIVGRGVLIDVPGLIGRAVAADEVVTLDDLTGALQRQGTTLTPGDILFVNFGRTGLRRSDVPFGSEPIPGVSIECAEWLVSQQPSLIVTDNGMDPLPSEVAGVPVPWHVVILVSMGVPLVDAAMLGPLAETCERLGRWEFFTTIAPLHIPSASGSPVNPLAIF